MTSDGSRPGVRLLFAALAVLLVASSIAPVVGAATAQSDSILTRDADLVVREPGYSDGSVQPTTANDRTVYPVQGERIWLKPKNFNATAVQDFGVEGGNATLEYDAAMDAFTFRPAGDQGTFTTYWVVREPVAVNQTVQRNGSNVTRTVTEYRQVRYEAIIKVTGGTSLAHLSESRIDELQSSAANWEEFNSTVQDLGDENLLLWQVTGMPSTEQIIQGMINTYVTTRDPARLLRGSFTKFLLVMVLTTGGLLYVGVREGFAALAMRRIKKELGVYKSTEHAEGDIAERAFMVDKQERERASANLDWVDRLTDPEANAMREAFGETPRDGFENVANHLLPGVYLTDRLKAMGQCGYAARITDREPTDDDEREEDDTAWRVTAAELVDLDDPRVDATLDDADIVDLTAIDGDDPDLDLVFALLENDERTICSEFDLTTADYDASQLDTSPMSYSLRELMDEIDLQYGRFDSMSTAGEALHEWIDVIQNSNYCEPDGTPRAARRSLNTFLTTSQWLGDDGPELPQARMLAEYLERVLIDYDPTRESAQLVQDIRDGKEVV